MDSVHLGRRALNGVQDTVPLYQLPRTTYYLSGDSVLLNLLRQRDPHVRQQLLEAHRPTVPYRPRSIQSGGAAHLYNVRNRICETVSLRNQRFHGVNNFLEGVVRNTQQAILVEDLDELQGHDLLANFSHQHIGGKVFKCRRRPSETEFIVKELCHNDWSYNMEIPLYCLNSSIVQPLAILFNYCNSYIFQPHVSGKSLSHLISKRRTRLSVDEADFICYELLSCLTELDDVNLLHRVINPCHIILPRGNQYVSLVGYGSMCRLENAVSWIPRSITTNYFVAPELARGEEHTSKCDVFGLGSTILSGILQKIPYFDINASQINEYTYRIASGAINPHDILRGIRQYCDRPNSQELQRMVKILTDMTVNDQNRRLSAHEIIRTYYNRNPVPQYQSGFFGTRTMSPDFDPITIPVPNLNAVAVISQNGINIPSFNIPSEEILSSAELADPRVQNLPQLNIPSDEILTSQVEAQAPVPKSPQSIHSPDSGRQTLRNPLKTIIVNYNGLEIRFEMEFNRHGGDVYKKIIDTLGLGNFNLYHDEMILQFETDLADFESRSLTFDLVQNARPRQNQRRQQGAAFNGDDHVSDSDSD